MANILSFNHDKDSIQIIPTKIKEMGNQYCKHESCNLLPSLAPIHDHTRIIKQDIVNKTFRSKYCEHNKTILMQKYNLQHEI